MPGTEPQRDPWIPIADRHDVLRNTLELSDRGWIDLSRLVITTDAGIGKSVAVDWLRAGMFQPQLTRRQLAKARTGHARLVESSGWMAFIVPPRVLREGAPEQVTQRLRDFMVHEVHGKIEDQGAKRESCHELVERHRRTGRLLLLFDGLDQMGDCEALARAVNSPSWSDCHLVIAGRPYALQRDWHSLFNDRRWRFIRVEEFTAEQQSRYLGRDRAGTLKIDKIPDEARAILTVPRVLYYIRELPDKKLAALKSAADVYYLAIHELIKRGMEKSPAALEMACDGHVPAKPQDRAILKTFQLLALIALDMVESKIRVATTDAAGNTVWHVRPNFYRVKRGEMAGFLERLEFRFPSTDFGRDWRALSALNTVLTHAVFDADVEGLVEIEFRNRSLQEFLAAYLLAQHGVPDHPPRSGDRAAPLPLDLGQCIFLPFEPETEDYYYVWQFLADMPADAVREDVWLESVAPLYLPAAPDQAGRWVAKRSNEMLFRTWIRVHQLCEQQHPRALAIREAWWSEFELTILAGKHGKQARRRAEQFKQSFLDLPGGTFSMGTPDDKQGQLSEGYRSFFERFLADAPDSDHDAYVQQTLDPLPWSPSRSGKAEREAWESFLHQVLDAGDMRIVERQFAREDQHQHDVSVPSFQLSRSPCLNAWYRLFDARHGESEILAQQYGEYSPSPDHPAIFVSWFDAWGFANGRDGTARVADCLGKTNGNTPANSAR